VVSTASARARLRRAVNLGLTRPIVLLSVGVLFPVVLATTVGIVTLSLSESSRETVIGVLAIVLATAAFVSGVVLTVWLGRRARQARLQSDLLSNVSHELKTPLAGIRMYAQTLEELGADCDPETLVQCASGIVRETHWLESMVERLLTWRSVPKDRSGLDLHVGPLEETVRAAAGRFQRMVSSSDGAFTLGPVERCVAAHDSQAVHTIIINLLSNAFKYSPPPRTIALSLRRVGAEACVAVQDRGLGIPRMEQGRILEPFYRVSTTAGGGAGGAGLGLAIVAALVAAHGGRLAIDSAPGEGSTFSVYLPCEKGDDR
jgi:two-component system phosphate regulon sensor histidine kinase PhoR